MTSIFNHFGNVLYFEWHVCACGPKTVPVKRTFLNIAIVGWGGGGHVNVPCTSYMKYFYSAEISGIVYYVTCLYAAEISGIVYYVKYCYVIVYSGIVYCDDAKKPKKTRPKFFQDFQSSHQHGTVVKSPFVEKRAFYGNGFRSGGMFVYLSVQVVRRIVRRMSHSCV